MGIQINGNTNNINAGIGSLSIEDIHELDLTGIATASNFKTGTSNVHSTGYECTNINASGIITATTFSGAFTGDITGAASQITVADESSDTSAFVVFTNTAAGNNAPKTGSNLTFNSATGALNATSFNGDFVGGSVFATSGAFTGNIDLNSDTNKLKIGAGDDFQFYHNGSNNFIETNNGDIRIKTSDSSGNLTFTAGGSTESVRINSNGQLLLGTTTTPSSANTKFRLHLPINTSSANAFEISHNTNGANKAGAALGLAIANGGASTNAADLFFQTASNGSLGTRMTLTSGGKLCLAGSTGQYTLNNTSTDIIIGSGGSGRGITFHTSAYADNMTISFHANENLTRAEGEIKYGPPLTTTTNDRNAMMFRTNSAERMRITSAGRIGLNGNTEPGGRAGCIDTSSNDGTSGKSFADMRGHSSLILRNPSTTQNSFTQLLFENGGGTSAATMFRHRLGSSHGSLQNFVGDLCLFRRVNNAGSGANDFRESTRFCGSNPHARQIWWAYGDNDTAEQSRLGWHHLSAQRDHPGTDAYSFFRLETGAASYARQGWGKYTCAWTTGHASGYGLATGHFGYYMHHNNSRIYVNEHIIYRERYSNGSYYSWDDAPNLRICNYTQSGGTNAAIVFRCGGRRHSGGFDMGVMVGLFIDLYVPETANGDTNPRLYVAGNSQSNLDGGGFGSPVNHDFCSFTSSNPNHGAQP